MGGESSQYDTLLTENNTILGVPNDPDFYFPDAMAERAVHWLQAQQTQSPDKPFFLYFPAHARAASCAEIMERQIQRQVRPGLGQAAQRVSQRQKQLGVIPADAKLTPRDPAFPAWDSLPPEQQKIYARQMEVYAGFQENADFQVGRVCTARSKSRGNSTTRWYSISSATMALSMEGTPTGTFNEIISLLGIPLTPEQQLRLIAFHGGIKEMGRHDPIRIMPRPGPGPATRRSLGESRSRRTWGAFARRWSCLGRSTSRIRAKCEAQFTHVIDVTPTILEVAGLPAPKTVDGTAKFRSRALALSTRSSTAAQIAAHHAIFPILGNRSIYKDGCC